MSHALEHARRFTAPRHVAGLFCASLALALAAPLSQSHIFAGRAAILALPAVVLGLKAVLLIVGSPVGYSACYWSPIAPLHVDVRERSFQLPFAGPQLTRIDRAIDLQPSRWNLSFFNSLRFNFWTRGSVRRDRLPYGGQFVLATTSSSIPENLVLRPATFAAAISGGPARRQVGEQLAFVLGSGPVLSAFVPVGVHGLPVIWLCCAWYCMREGSPISRLVYLVPVAYLGVHLFFQVDAYYPRHIVIGYESAGLAAAILLRRRTQTPFEPSPWSHTRRAPPVMSS